MKTKYMQNIAITSGKFKKEKEYWMEKLAGSLTISQIRPDYLFSSFDDQTFQSKEFQFPTEITQFLAKLSNHSPYGMYVLLVSGLSFLLSRYTDNQDIIIGTPILQAGVTEGLLNHLLALRNQIDQEMSFKDMVMNVRETVREANQNQNYPFYKLLEALDYPAEEDHFPFSNVFVMMEQIQNQRYIEDESYDILFKFSFTESGLRGTVEYKPGLFRAESIDQIICQLTQFYTIVAKNPAISLREIQILTPEQVEEVLVEWNHTAVAYPADQVIHQLFEEQVAKTPERIAVVLGKEEWSYGELNQRANQLARALRAEGVQPDQIVALLAKPSLEMMVGLLAVLKAGGAYLPIDPDYPENRIGYLLEDSQCRICLSHQNLAADLDFAGKIIDLEDQNLYQGDESNLPVVNRPEHLVYVIYTSGSTGLPKGVMIEHRGLVNYATWASKMYVKEEECAFPLYSSLSFDLTVTSIYVPLITGNRVMIYGADDKEILIEKILNEDRVQVMKLTPAHLQMIKNMNLTPTRLRRFIVGGEELKTELASEIDRKFNAKVEIYNEYGPTETVVGCMIHQYDPIRDVSTSVPIGLPAQNVQIYLLDETCKPTGYGIPGEVYISGAGVARGYLNRQELTAEKFIVNPFIPGQRMYRTGDLARRLATGEVEFLGRMDHQVKMSGYRIELGEIESQLMGLEGIQDAVVVDRKAPDGDTYLCAYIVPEGSRAEDELTAASLRRQLGIHLPEYMIPTYFVKVDRIPLTTNGKVDRNRLPDPVTTREREILSPGNPMEEKILRIWQQVLGQQEISITDNFFEIGGHSLKANQLLVNLREQMKVKMTIKEIFDHPTIAELAEKISTKEELTQISIQPCPVQAYYPLSSAQKRLFIVNQLEPNAVNYNIPFFYTIQGRLDLQRLKQAFERLMERHEMLRTAFLLIDGEPLQQIHETVDLQIQTLRGTEKEIDQMVREFVQPFDLSQAPLFRAGVVALEENKHLLLLDMHHIISDAVSRDIFFEELIQLYYGQELLPLRIQYKDFAVWQNHFLQSEQMKEKEQYWLNAFSGELPVLNLPTDYPRPEIMTYQGDMLGFQLDEDLTQKLNKLAVKNRSTLFMLLLAAYNVFLAQYSGQSDIIVGTPDAGRLHPDLDGIIGIFLNTLPLRNYPEGTKTFEEFLAEVRQTSLAAYQNQEYPLETLVGKLDLPRKLNRMPLLDVMFVFLNTDELEMNLQGLEIKPYSLKDHAAKMDLTLFAFEREGKLQCSFSYSTELFTRLTLENMVQGFIEILTAIVSNPTQSIKDLMRPAAEERARWIAEFNEDLRVDVMKTGTLLDHFYRVVDRTPDHAAIEYGTQTVTYNDLDQRSNGVAQWLISRNTHPGCKIGLFIRNRADLVVFILAAVKTRSVFVPFDTNYPIERVRSMTEAVELELIFTDSEHRQQMEEIFTDRERKPEVVLVNSLLDGMKENTLVPRPLIRNLADDPLYIYFTSGSTGKPKGIVGRYESLQHFIQWQINTFDWNDQTKVSQLASSGFDAMLRDVFAPLCTGGTLCIPESHHVLLHAEQLVKWIEAAGVHIMHCVPSIFKSLNLYPLQATDFPTLRYIIMAGEKLNPGDVSRWYEIFGDRIQLVNLYGATETTLIKHCYFIQKEDRWKRTIPVGKPMANTRALVLDDEQGLCKTGVTGEVYIRTPYRTFGYTDAKLTQEIFIPNPFLDDPNDWVYRTGDLGRMMFDGNLEFVGRKDKQVKIHGVRIELGDIENQILSYEPIRQSIVVVQNTEDGDSCLAAYYVSTEEVNVTELRNYLQLRLPQTMIPAYLMQLERLPLNPNGKVDQKALPKPAEILNTNAGYTAPRNLTEERLSQVWTEVLGLEKVGIDSNFFAIGGHSLKATALVAKINKAFDVQLPLQEIFKKPTIRELSACIADMEKMVFTSIEPLEPKEYYRLSSAQKRVFVINMMEPDSLNYNMPILLKVEGDLDVERLQTAVNELVQRHEAFRTSIVCRDGEYYQKIDLQGKVEVEQVNLQDQLWDEQKVAAQMRAFVRPFDLSRGPLLRVGLVTFLEQYLLMIDMHHIISDGVSQSVIFPELIRLYHGESLPDLRIQYKDFAEWQQKFLQSPAMKKQERFWLERYFGEIPVLHLPTDYPRPSMMSFEGSRIGFTVSEEITQRLRGLAYEQNATLFMILLAAYQITLSKYSGQEDIIVGSPLANRRHTDLENVVGMFINTLPFRNEPQGDKSLIQFLHEVRENSLKVYENQDYQFEMLVDQLGLARDTSRNPVYETLLVLHNLDRQQVSTGGVQFSTIPYEGDTAKFDITLIAQEWNGQLRFSIEYRSRLFTRETMERFAEHFTNVCKAIATDPAIILDDIQLLSPEERELILVGFNQNQQEYPPMTMYQMVEEQVIKTPDDTALVFGDQRMTYDEYNKKANRLARKLRERGIGPEKTVTLLMEHSLDMAIAVLAMLKSGGAYVPINPKLPKERVQFIVQDSQSELILTHSQAPLALLPEGVECWILDEPVHYPYDDSNLEPLSTAENLAYIIYTSGSTGQPKGVLTLHDGFYNTIYWRKLEYNLTREDRALQLFNYSFDGFLMSFFTPLVSGSEIHIINDSDASNAMSIKEVLVRSKITYIGCVPSLYSVILDALTPADACDLRIVALGGERVSPELVKRSKQINPNLEIANEYGPTETTIISTSQRNLHPDQRVTIGKPLANEQVYILDRNLRPVPIGVIGEIYIAGKGLARGYLNRPELTAEKFIPHPFEPGQRIYRTGDLGRWLPTGQIDYIGRIDNQVKIRGYRIELGEIENQLLTLPHVKECVVIDHKVGVDVYLTAYLVAEEGVAIADLKEGLARTLPAYMVPTYYVLIDKVPLTPNNKVDYRALPSPVIAVSEQIVEPENQVEEVLVECWKELLRLDLISVEDSFFELGGHSLKATQLITRIHQEFGVEIPLIKVFEKNTIRELAQEIIQAERNVHRRIEPVEWRPSYPVSSAQKRMYLINQMNPGSVNYNIPIVLTITGELNDDRLRTAFVRLVERHEALRTSFAIEDDEVVQIIHETVELELQYTQADEASLTTVIQDFIKPFDLSEAPLIRVQVVQCGEKHLLLIDMHHIIEDGLSQNIVFHDLVKLYDQQILSPLHIQYKDYAVWHNQFLASNEMQKQEEYWLNTFSSEIPVLQLPLDYIRPTVKTYDGDRVRFHWNREMTQGIHTLAQQYGATLFMVLLAGFNLLLAKYSGQEDIIIGTPIAGRKHVDVEQVMGMFVNTLALRNQPVENQSLAEFLQQVKMNTLKAFDHQDYPFEKLVDMLHLTRDTSRNPLFDAELVLQNIELPSIKINELEFAPFDFEHKVAKFDLSVVMMEADEKLYGEFKYNTRLFKEETIQKMVEHYTNILREMVAHPDTVLADIDWISSEEKQFILTEMNQTHADYPRDTTVYQLFEEQARMHPDRVALICNEQQLTYRELDQRANQVARFLREQGVRRNQIVGILVDHSIEAVVGILAILKASGAYLPLTPDYPMDRITYMLKDSEVNICLTQGHLEYLIDDDIDVVLLDHDEVYCGDATPLESTNKPGDLAYVIYTSGSTGKPKGVMVHHRGLVNYVTWASKVYVQGQRYDFPLYSSLAFDLTVTSIYTPLICGNKVIIYAARENEMAISNVMDDNRVQVIKLTPAHLQIINSLERTTTNVKRFIVGGEQLKTQLAREIFNKFAGKVEIFNEYGPTEAIVGCMIHRYDPDRDKGYVVPIGVPADNVQIYLLDSSQKPVPIHVPGEMYIAGDGVSQGYLHRPALTDEKFVNDPFHSGMRMYRTGDLARRLPNGLIEFIGRIDNQVKLRGYRIELGEIEDKILHYPEITEAIVLIQTDNADNDSLCAYYVAPTEIPMAELRGFLSHELPEYMIPHHFVHLAQMPLTTNGKIDKAALLDMRPVFESQHNYVAPRTELEARLAKIWSEILGVDPIGVHDQFFDLGGYSLKGIKLIAKIRKELNLSITMYQLFEKQTISELAKIFHGSTEDVYAAIQSAPVQADYPMSFAQYRIFVATQLEDVGVSYNVPSVMTIRGKVDRERFESAFETLIQRHETLRTSFDFKDDQYVQIVHQKVDFQITDLTAEEETVDTVIRQFFKPFDLAVAPLLRVGLIEAEDQQILVLDTHHIISDGVSQEILTSDFLKLYSGQDLAPLRLQYKDYSVWQQQEYFRSDQVKQQGQYWLSTLQGMTPLQMPTDYPRSSMTDFTGDQIYFELAEEKSRQLKELAGANRVTMFMLLLTVYQILLAKYIGQEDIVVGTVVAGRSHPDLHNIVGMFVNPLVLRNHVDLQTRFVDCLEQVRVNTLQAYDHQEYPFDLLVDQMKIQRNMNRNPIFDTLFYLDTVEAGGKPEDWGELSFEPYFLDKTRMAKFDFSLGVVESPIGLRFTFEYRTQLFARETFQTISIMYQKVLEQIMENPMMIIKDIQTVSEDSKQMIEKNIELEGLEEDFDF